NLEEKGLRSVLDDRAAKGVPILGICLGVQLMARRSEEGQLPGLGWLDADVKRFSLAAPLSVPHMGWNEVEGHDHVFSELDSPRFYFVHSYHLVCDRDSEVIGWTTYGYRFASAIRRDRIIGTQFHPEKSHRFGMRVLRNFVASIGDA